MALSPAKSGLHLRSLGGPSQNGWIDRAEHLNNVPIVTWMIQRIDGERGARMAT